MVSVSAGQQLKVTPVTLGTLNLPRGRVGKVTDCCVTRVTPAPTPHQTGAPR